jgi:hypothetical protein
MSHPRPSERGPGGEAAPPRGDGAAETSPGWRTGALVLVLYAACIAIATYPRVLEPCTTLPSGIDPVQHLMILRWYKTCLLEGRDPLLLPGIQYPLGSPLGNTSPLYLQGLLYLPLSAIVPNDVACYNVLWFAEFLLAGMGAFALAWHVVRDRASACVGGLLAMLGGPMMLHAHGHLELMTIGLFPLFLVAWMRFLDRPGRGRLAAAVLAYVLMAMGAAYFAVLAVLPAALYAGYGAARAGGGARADWLRVRAAWLAGFAALVVPCLLLLFAPQWLGVLRGDGLDRSLREYARYGAPPWSYVTPTVRHGLARALGFDADAGAGAQAVECASYLGVVSLALIGYAAVRRVAFRDAAYWWSAVALLVVLSFGAYLRIGARRVDLPGLWLWQYAYVFRLIRAPARFNLLAAVGAAVVAAAGLRHLLDRFSRPGTRTLVCGALIALAVADLAMVPFGAAAVPPMPACYALLRRRDPGMTLLELPLQVSGNAEVLNALTGYWQAFHRGRTTGGYSSRTNVPFDHQLVHNSPFSAPSMAEPGYLQDPGAARFGILQDVAFGDYAWLYLSVHGLKYVVLHQWPGAMPGGPAGIGRLKARLAAARIFEDGATAVYGRDRLQPPARPALICTEGWRGGWHGREVLILSGRGGIAAYNPAPDEGLIFTLEAQAPRTARTVRLRDGDAELARWVIQSRGLRTYQTPPFRLPGGLRHLALEVVGPGPAAPGREAAHADRLIVGGIRLRAAGREPSPPAGARSGGVVRR